MQHRDRRARLGVEHPDAALAAQGGAIVATGDGETGDDLVRDMIEVLTGMCTRRSGRRGARDPAVGVVTATSHDGRVEGSC